jgi:hypothetical protein
MSRPGHKRAIVAVALALMLCLLLATLLLLPDRNSLPALQKRIAETGSCRISTPANNLVIQADTARFEDDVLILEKSAATGDNALVLVNMNSDTFAVKSVSVRLITSPADRLELTYHDLRPVNMGPTLYIRGALYLEGECNLRIRLDRHWTLRQWFQHFRRKLRSTFK